MQNICFFTYIVNEFNNHSNIDIFTCFVYNKTTSLVSLFFFQLHVNIVTSPKMRNYKSIRHVVSSPCVAILSLHCLTTNVSNDESNLNIKVIHVSFEKKNIVNIHPPVKNKTYRYLILLNDGIVAIKPNKFNTYKLFDS